MLSFSDIIVDMLHFTNLNINKPPLGGTTLPSNQYTTWPRHGVVSAIHLLNYAITHIAVLIAVLRLAGPKVIYRAQNITFKLNFSLSPDSSRGIINH